MLLAELPGGNLVNYGVTGLFIFSVVVFGLFARQQVWFGAEWILLIVWLTYAAIPALLAQDLESSMFKVLTILQLAIWALAIKQAILWRRSVSAPLLMYGAAVTGAYVFSFVGVGVGVQDGAPDAAGRVASTLANANAFGASAVMGLGLCFLAATLGLRDYRRLFQVLLALALIVAVASSGSRTAMLGTIFLLLGTSWAFRFWNMRQAVRFLPSLLVFSAVAAVFYLALKDIPEFAERIDGVFSLEDPNSAVSRLWDFVGVIGAGSVNAEQGGESMSQRLDLVLLGFDLLLQSNLVGIGPGNFGSLVGTYSHSNVIEVLVATGVIGFLLYYSIYLALAVRCLGILRKDRNQETARMALVALATLAIMDIQHVSYDTKQGWLFLAVLIGTVELTRRQLVAKVANGVVSASAKPPKRSVPSEEIEPSANPVFGLSKQLGLNPSAKLHFDTSRRIRLTAARKLDE